MRRPGNTKNIRIVGRDNTATDRDIKKVVVPFAIYKLLDEPQVSIQHLELPASSRRFSTRLALHRSSGLKAHCDVGEPLIEMRVVYKRFEKEVGIVLAIFLRPDLRSSKSIPDLRWIEI